MNSVRLLLRSFSTRKSKSLSPSPPKPSDTPFHPKPPDIPFQPKLANSVNIIGEVHSPVQFQTSPDGNASAATVITRPDSPSSPSLEIPVIFEGDLAHTAFSHLKPHDFIHVAGQLSTHPPHLLTNNIQVMVQSLNFVQGYPQLKDKHLSAPSTHTVFPISTGAKKSPNSPLSSWSELLDDPKEWRDFRDCKVNGLVNPRHPDFKRKDGNGSLWLNRAPTWVLSKLEGLEFDVPAGKSKQTKEFKGEQSWNDLVQNPAKWWDNRSNKTNKRAPDFKHKETGEVLWLNGSPSWVLSKLPPLKPKQSIETGSMDTVATGVAAGTAMNKNNGVATKIYQRKSWKKT